MANWAIMGVEVGEFSLWCSRGDIAVILSAGGRQLLQSLRFTGWQDCRVEQLAKALLQALVTTPPLHVCICKFLVVLNICLCNKR